MDSEISKRVNGYLSQEVCPWNQRFAQALPGDSPFAPSELLRDEDARTFADDLLQLSQEEFSAAFKGSPMKRAKLAGLKRNARAVLENLSQRANPLPASAHSGDAGAELHSNRVPICDT